MATSEKTLNDYINGRIIDKIYIPRDTQALYDLRTLLSDNSEKFSKKLTNDEIIAACDDEDSRVDALKAKIKESSDCLTLRSMRQTELIRIGEHVNEFISQLKKDSPDISESDLKIPFREQFNTHLFLNSIVSMADKDGRTANSQDKTIDEWVGYLEDIMDNQPASYLRLIEKIQNLRVTAEQEKSMLEDLDFLD